MADSPSADHPTHLPQQQQVMGVMFRMRVVKKVWGALGGIARELGELTNGMTAEEKKAARLLILEMMMEGARIYDEKMKARIERNEPANTENGKRVSR